MTNQTASTVETLYYEYDLRRLPLTPLNRYSVDTEHEMQADPTSFLNHYQYKQISSPNEQVTLYRSTWASSEYLVVVQASDTQGTSYRLVFSVWNDKALVAWKKEYLDYLHRITTMEGILPAPAQAADKDMKVIHLDRRALQATNGYY